MSQKKINWDEFNRGVFLVNTLGVIFDPAKKRFLIGRRDKDKYVENLSWVFPGGRPSYDEDLEKSFEKVIERKTGLKVKSLGPIFARLFKENNRFLLIYYLCEVVDGKEKPADDIEELKWVKADELEKYFTTSLDPRLKEFITHLR
ncbi:MAG: NUDIX domain-containing protein [Nanoarchaeota archaeon]